MTQRDSAQDFDPKHRIVGAIIVVALAVIFIPMILSDRESSTERPDAQPIAPQSLAEEPNKVAVTKLTPPAAVEEPAKSTSATAPSTEKTQAEKPAAESAGEKAAAPKPSTAPAAAEAKPPSSGWVVQVGTFSNKANATRLEKKLRAEGHPVLKETVKVGGTSAVRLRVGPYADRGAALKARERVNKDVGVKGVVLAYP